MKKYLKAIPANHETRSKLIPMKHLYYLLLPMLIAITSFAQTPQDTTDHRFHDDLLDHLVGNWNDTSVAHGSTFTSEVDAGWVLNHQYLLLHLKSNEVVP